MSKLVLTILIAIVFILIAISIIFNGVSINKYNNIVCKNDQDAVNANNNIKVSITIQCIALFLLVFAIIYTMIWNYRRLRSKSRKLY